MSRTTDELLQREQTLEQQGADPLRIELLRRARSFKRSWIDMAEALQQIREGRDYEQWGYADLYDYCDQELLIKRKTVDKLAGSFSTLQQHAPTFLEEGGDDAPVPSCDSVEYFARAVDGPKRDVPRPDPPPEALDALHHAVFQEARPVNDLRKEFNPVFFAKSEEQVEVETLRRARATAQRLAAMLAGIDGLSKGRVKEVEAVLDELKDELEGLLEPAQERLQATG